MCNCTQAADRIDQTLSPDKIQKLRAHSNGALNILAFCVQNHPITANRCPEPQRFRGRDGSIGWCLCAIATFASRAPRAFATLCRQRTFVALSGSCAQNSASSRQSGPPRAARDSNRRNAFLYVLGKEQHITKFSSHPNWTSNTRILDEDCQCRQRYSRSFVPLPSARDPNAGVCASA